MRFALLSAALVVLCLAAAPDARAQQPAGAPRNVVLMIADGAGPATFTMARDFERYRQGAPARGAEQAVRLALDSIKLGSIQTFAEDSRVTDSAAGATAFSTGHKTTNGHIAVDPAGRPLATLLEAAERRGMATGLVVTSRLTHATPASFAAHVPDRWQENEIARQMLTQDVDVLLGGGRRHFLPQGREASRRQDDRDLMAEARAAGYTVVTEAEGFAEASALPLLGLFADGHMRYEIDRASAVRSEGAAGAQPSLEAMTEKALRLLGQSEEGRENGVFLVVEGSRIDHAGHDNDPAAHLHDALAYDRAVARVRRFAEQNPQTLLLSTADHETGGLSLGRAGEYAWQPSALAGVQASSEVIARRIYDRPGAYAAVVQQMTGIDSLRGPERALLEEAIEAEELLPEAVSELISRRALVGWTSTGHTAVDVGLHGYGPGASRFAGHFDNTHVGAELARLMGFDLDALTAALRRQAPVSAAGK